MALLPITILDEYYIKYRKINSPIFRLNGALKSIKCYKIKSFSKFNEILKLYDPPYVYKIMYEELGNDQCFYVMNAHINGLGKDEEFPFISDDDNEYTLVQYIVQSQAIIGDTVETIAVGNKSFKSAIEAVVEVYRDNKDFKFLHDFDDLLFKKIEQY